MAMNDDQANSLLGKTAPGPAPALVSGGDLAPGYVVGEYRVEQVIGRGGMGVVYSGLHPLIEKRVAIKVLSAQLSADPSLVRRFVDEARAVNRIRHPNIIDIFSFGQLADSRQYFVMEYLEGHTLADRLQAGDLPLPDLPPLLGQICDALDAAHGEKIVHRDLKPENIWIVSPRRGRPFVKLLDFGIAKLLATGEQSTTQAGAVMGTPQYMSPEQCHGRAIDHRTDIYAMGVILYQMYTGRLPFHGETFAEILAKQLTYTPDRPSTHASLPAALDELIMRCLDKDPAGRPQSARELGEALATVLIPRTMPAVVAGKTVREANTTTTLRGSAHASAQVALATAPPRRWPIVVGLFGAGLAAAFGATRLAHRASDGAPAVFGPGPSRVSAQAAEPAAVPQVAPAPAAGPDARLAEAVALPTTPESGMAKDPGRPEATGHRNKVAGRDSAQVSAGHPARTRASNSGLVTDNPFR